MPIGTATSVNSETPIETAIISATTEELQLKDFPMDPESQQVSLVPVQTAWHAACTDTDC